MNKWEKSTLGEVITFISKGTTPSASMGGFSESGINFVKSESVCYNGTIDRSKFAFITEEVHNRLKRSQLYENDILFSMAGVFLGKNAIVTKDILPANTNQALAIIRINNELAFYKFIHYSLRQKSTIYYIHSIPSQSAQPNINFEEIKSIPINLPPIDEQKRIADVLSALDDKIEINNKINENLEAQAQAIFKQWFVDFEFPDAEGKPYKTNGGEFIDSELGEIPVGWKIGTLGAIVRIIDNRGKTPPLSDKKTQYPIIDVKALNGVFRFVDYNNCMKFVNYETYNSWFRSGHPKENDILISTVGSLAEMKIFTGNIGAIAQNVVALRPDISTYYLYQYLLYIKSDLLGYDIGSVQPSIKVTHLIKHQILIPSVNNINTFDTIMNEISKKISNNQNEICNLSEIRDSLLPKLMNGEVRV